MTATSLDQFKKLQPKAYLEAFLKQGFRPDARSVDDFRKVDVNSGSISTANGSALVRLGDTTVVCGIRAEIAEPLVLQPDLGFIVANLELPASCSSQFRSGPPSDEAQAMSARVHDVLLASFPIPLSSLCIQPMKAVWTLYIDMICINYDGNIIDAAILAATAALRNTQLPNVEWDEDSSEVVTSQTTASSSKIALPPFAFSYSFSIFDDTLLADPSAFEESLSQASINVILDEGGQLINILQTGTGAHSHSMSVINKKCVKLAKGRHHEIRNLLP